MIFQYSFLIRLFRIVIQNKSEQKHEQKNNNNWYEKQIKNK